MTPRQRSWLSGAVALVVLCGLPFVVYPVVALDILCWGLFALAFDLVFGQVGLLSFGHAAFWGTSAYVTGFLLLHLGTSVPVAMLGARWLRSSSPSPSAFCPSAASASTSR